MLKLIWVQHKENMEKPAPDPILHHWVELTAALERPLNYAHTGSTKVLTRALMDPLWLGPSLIHDGLPTLSSIVCRPGIHWGHFEGHIQYSNWPVTGNPQHPHMASRRSFAFNYGEDQLVVRNYAACSLSLSTDILLQIYEAQFQMAHALKIPVPEGYNSSLADDVHRPLYLFDIALQIIENDIQSLVERGVKESTDAAGQDVSLSKERIHALKQWLSIDNQSLGYRNSAHSLLVHAIASDAATITNGLPLSRGSPQTVRWFAEQLIASAALDSVVCKAPFVSGGADLHAMRAALAEVTSTLCYFTF